MYDVVDKIFEVMKVYIRSEIVWRNLEISYG